MAMVNSNDGNCTRISSKPPSSDLLIKPEKREKSSEKKPKKSPGGQLGHQGKTRKGFGRVDHYEILKAENCLDCGQLLTKAKSIKVEKKSVAVLVEKPIEIVEYQRYHLQCECCGKITSPQWCNQIVPGQDLGIKLQGFLGWLVNYGHLPYKKQQELLMIIILKKIRKLLQNASIYLFIASLYIVTTVDRVMAIVSGSVGDVNGICDGVLVGGTCSEISWFGIKAAAVFFGSFFALGALMNLIRFCRKK